MDEDSGERRGFRVTDRRRFSDSGDARAEAPVEQPESPAAPAPEPVSPPRSEREEEPLTFSTFVLGLSTQALLHLGEIPDPTTHKQALDLAGAKQVIDILGILREKTRNNLEPGEQSLLDSVLYDLRMRYVELVRPGLKEGT